MRRSCWMEGTSLMESMIILISPLNDAYLGATLQTLMVTTCYDDFSLQYYPRRGEKVLENPLLNSVENLSFLDPHSPLPSTLIPLSESCELIILVPPGTIFLREGWFTILREAFYKNPDLDLLYSDLQGVQIGSSSSSFPSCEGLLCVRPRVIQKLREELEILPPAALGAALWLEAQRSMKLKTDFFHIYEGSISTVALFDMEDQWKYSYPILMDLRRKNVDTERIGGDLEDGPGL